MAYKLLTGLIAATAAMAPTTTNAMPLFPCTVEVQQYVLSDANDPSVGIDIADGTARARIEAETDFLCKYDHLRDNDKADISTQIWNLPPGSYGFEAKTMGYRESVCPATEANMRNINKTTEKLYFEALERTFTNKQIPEDFGMRFYQAPLIP
jgi:hypothetical protein